MQKQKKGPYKLALALLIIGITAGLGFVFKDKLTQKTKDITTPSSPSAVIEKSSTVKPKTTRLVATGDFIAHEAMNIRAKANDGSYSYGPFMDQMKPLLAKSDIRFCNQATLVGGEKFGVTGYPSFNAPAQFAADMVGVGCNVINTASNHSSDKSQAVIDANVAIWQSLQGTLTVAGQNSSEDGKQVVHYFEVDGLKYAFLAYTTYSNSTPPTSYGVSMYSRDFAGKQIAAAKQAGAKFIIVSMRWGTEYSEGVNSYQTAEAQYLADNGASLVLGHGPHVLEPVQKLKGTMGNETIVWYSLGNFLHAQLEAETLFNGIAVMDIDPKTATVLSVGFLPTYMHYDWTPTEAASQSLLARKNFELVPLEDADELFKKSQLKTTIAAQTQRLAKTLATYTEVKMLSLKDL